MAVSDPRYKGVVCRDIVTICCLDDETESRTFGLPPPWFSSALRQPHRPTRRGGGGFGTNSPEDAEDAVRIYDTELARIPTATAVNLYV
jgi:hypothetical protein